MHNYIIVLPHSQGVGGGILIFQKSQFGHWKVSEKDSDVTYPPIYWVSEFNRYMTLNFKGQGHI